jgi:sugar-specific transcriptional regulator TrmB
MDLSEEKEDKESESGNRTNNLHILAKVIENSLITVFNIYPIFWYLREKITDAFVRQVALEGVVDPFSFLKSAKNHCLRGLAPF